MTVFYKYLISNSFDTAAKIWSATSWKLLDTIVFHTNDVYAVKIIKRDTSYLAITVGLDNQIALYDIQKRAIIASDKSNYKLMYLATTANHIAVSGIGKEIRIYDYQLKLLHTIESETEPSGLSYSPDGKLLIAGFSFEYRKPTDMVNIYNKEKNYKLLASFQKHTNLTQSVAFLNNNTAISAGGDNYEIVLWDSQTTKIKNQIVGVGASVWSVGVKGDSVGLGNEGRDVHNENSWNIQKTINLKTMQIGSKLPTNIQKIKTTKGNFSLTHKAGGEYGYDDTTLILTKDKNEIEKITKGSTDGYRHNCYGFYKEYIISGGINGHLKIYNLKGKEVAKLVGHRGEVMSIAVDGDRLVSGGSDQTLRVWDLSRLKTNNEKQKITLCPQLNIFISKTNDHIAWTNEGYFTASENATQYLYFHINQGADKEALAIPMKSLYDRFYRPDLIQLKLSGDEEAYQKAINGMDYKKVLSNLHQ